MSITVSEKQFKSSAKRLKSLLDNQLTDKFSYNQCLQLLSQSLTDKPFEELKETLFNEKNKTTTNFSTVVILHYGSEAILTVDGAFVKQLCVGSDMEISFYELYNVAKIMANEKNMTIREFNLPQISYDDWQIDDIINLAEKLGYFKYEKPLIDVIEDSQTIIFNNVFTGEFIAKNNLNGDWEQEFDDPEDLSDVIWFLEHTTEDYRFFELYFTLKNIGNAVKIKGKNNQWLLKDDDGHEFTITLL